MPEFDEAIQTQLKAPKTPSGEPILWSHPFLVFLAEHGRIGPTDTQTKAELLLPTEQRKPEFMLEFFAYETVHCISPRT